MNISENNNFLNELEEKYKEVKQNGVLTLSDEDIMLIMLYRNSIFKNYVDIIEDIISNIESHKIRREALLN